MYCIVVALRCIALHCVALRCIVLSGRMKFRSQTSDNMERWKAEQGRGREKRKPRRKKSRRERVRRQKMEIREKVGKSRNTAFFQWFVAPEGRKVGSLKRRVRSQLARGEIKSQKKEDGDARKGRKVAKHCVFPMICGSGGSKSRLAKAAGAEPAGQMRDENLHAVVARSTFWSQNVQNTPPPDHFWKLRCWKSARRCGAKHISKSKCTKHQGFGPLLEVQMSKKCMPLWREAHVEVKMYKTHHARTLLEVEMLKKCTPLWHEAHFEVKMHKTPFSDHFWKLRCWKSARRCGAKHILKSKCTKHTRSGPLLEVAMSEKVHAVVARSTFPSQNVQNTTCSRHFWRFGCRKSAVVARSTFPSQNVQSTPGPDHFWRFRCRFASIHYTTGHYTTLHSSTLHCTTLHSSTLHYTKLHYTTLHYTEWHCNTDRQVDS